MASAAAQLASLGTPHIVITGGGLGGDECVDAVWTPTGTRFMRSPRIDAPNTRGAGCMFSAMITANLARGRGAMEAITLAKEHVTRALTAAAAHARDVAQTTELDASPGRDPDRARTSDHRPTPPDVRAQVEQDQDQAEQAVRGKPATATGDVPVAAARPASTAARAVIDAAVDEYVAIRTLDVA